MCVCNNYTFMYIMTFLLGDSEGFVYICDQLHQSRAGHKKPPYQVKLFWPLFHIKPVAIGKVQS